MAFNFLQMYISKYEHVYLSVNLQSRIKYAWKKNMTVLIGET